MNVEAMPIIRLEIDRLKMAVNQMLGVVGSEFSDAIGAEIDKALDEYPFEDVVRDAVTGCLNNAINDYFKFGDGRKAIQEQINSFFKSGE